MADKSFGVDQLDILGTGTPTISAPNQLNLDCNTVAISTSATVGQNLTVSANAGISSLNVTGIATVVNFNATGISTIAVPSNTNANSALLVTANGSSAYRFTGPGQDGSDDNPNIYLVRGQRYIFTNNSGGSHPFQIRVANGGAAYSTGVTNNGASSGNIIFNVQHDAPAQLYYQCTNHGGMVGNIYVVGGPQVISGVLTATSFSGSGANLTSLPSQVTINNASANRVLTSDGGTTLNGEANLTFNSSLVVTDGNGTVTTGGNYINLKRTSGDTNYINAPLADAELHISADENIIFKTVHTGDFNSTERLRIASNGTLTSTASNNGQIIHTFKNTDATGSSFAMTVEQHFNFNRTGGGLNLSAARIVAGKEREWVGGAANQDGFLAFYTALNETPSEKLRIDSSGTIQVKGDGGNNNKIYGYDGADLAWILGNNNSDDPEFTNFRSGNLKFKTGGTERLRIDSSGRVLINTTSHTNVENGSTNAQYLYQGYKVSSRDSTSNREHLVFYNPNGDVGSINTSGSNTSYTTASDYRLKENETAISDGITRLKTLKPYRFNFKVDKDTTVDGFFAHEVTAVPEAITGTKDEVDSDNKPVYQGIDQSKLVPLLTAALQEAITKIETLEAKVATLEGS